ncbi:hypothetical protein AAL_01901 [Moelleriella libera RCEF 2490]|uniref:Alpha-L-rhamnosidase C n=1 Tax=Moelleriella libera RCEF 2490 TaxID=1081109 RepID=A0A168F046_9HYPO|nr:hypothetical protein AAL_01901 [Moelleriella libera RCEF 2490]
MSEDHDHNRQSEPFPSIDQDAPKQLNRASSDQTVDVTVPNRSTASSSITGRLRRVSQSFEQSELPEGFFAATGGIASSILSRQIAPRPKSNSIRSIKTQQGAFAIAAAASSSIPTVPEETRSNPNRNGDAGCQLKSDFIAEPPSAAPFANGYHFPPKHSFGESMQVGVLSFKNYILTPLGFVVTIYGLNVVAWGGMLFLLLCNAGKYQAFDVCALPLFIFSELAPAMCHPSCDDINSPRRIWIEIDSQILNALFCVTGFGLAPWRFRDLFFLLQYRLAKRVLALRRLAGIHRGWFRLEYSNELPPDLSPRNVNDFELQPGQSTAIPFPPVKLPDAPLTGVRASPTKLWKLDLVIWLMVANTLLQCVLSGFMWGMNRFDRPSWSTGLFVALGCVAAAAGGFIMFLEGKAVKGVEGVPLSRKDIDRLEEDREQGVWHFNNIRDKDLEAKKKKKRVTD